MIDELKRQMSHDLNIYKYKNEMEKEYNQRLIYSGLASWVRSLICGNSINDYAMSIEDKFPDIMYVQSNLTKVAEAFLNSFDVDENWIEVDENQNRSSVLAGAIIQGMIYLNEIAEINSRQLAPVPNSRFSYKGWIHEFGRDTFSKKHMSIGLSQWTNSSELPTDEKRKIIDVKGKEYLEHIRVNFIWKKDTIHGDYEVFKVGSDRRYSKSWEPFDNSKLHEGIYLLREANSFEPGYLLYWVEGNNTFISPLDPWYIESREVYRIMYAMNYENGTPAKFRIKDRDDYFVLFYPSRLPDEENRLLFSLSWPYISCQDKFARVFPKQFMEFVEEEIYNLGAYISK